MNLSRFQLRARPFRTTPDVQAYYPATPHESVLQHLGQALEDEEGFALVTGEPGVGKSLIAHLFLSRLGAETPSGLLTNCRFASRGDMLRAILYDLAQQHQGLGEQELRLALTDYFLAQLAAGKPTVLVFDEAQGLTPDLLEELRLLGNLETGHGKALQIVLVAQPVLGETLFVPDLAALNQRLAVRLHLEALNVHEAADYLLHQIRVAGGRVEKVITDEAVSVLAKNTRGIPRLLNQAGHLSLSIADGADADLVDVEVALEALATLGIETDLDHEESESKVHLADLMSAGPEPALSKTSYVAGQHGGPKRSPGVKHYASHAKANLPQAESGFVPYPSTMTFGPDKDD